MTSSDSNAVRKAQNFLLFLRKYFSYSANRGFNLGPDCGWEQKSPTPPNCAPSCKTPVGSLGQVNVMRLKYDIAVSTP